MSHPLCVAFLWHMHQPCYRDLATGSCSMPWVRLHAAKDYVDMVERLDAFPNIRQTVNVVPSLLDQLDAYLPPANGSDTFLELSRKAAGELSSDEQLFLLRWFFMANLERMIQPVPRYHDLLAKRGLHVQEERWPAIQARFRTQDYLDLQVWFNLERMIQPVPRYHDLLAKRGLHVQEERWPAIQARFRTQDYLDLQVWFN